MQLAEGISLMKITRVKNANYIFLDLMIDKNAKAGKKNFHFGTGENKITIDYELKERRKGNGTAFAQGITSSDFIYLLMPERFSNGDTSNDRIAGLKDQSLNRDSIYLRHGGDFCRHHQSS